MHEQIASQYAPGDDLPCADAWLLAPLKKSPEYRALRPRVASPRAVDSWQDQGVHFFVFQLNPVDGAAAVPDDPPVVVFAMHPEEPAPVSAVVVTPRPGGEEAEVVDLRQPDSAYTAPYAGATALVEALEPEPENGGDANESISDEAPTDTEQLLSAEPTIVQAEELPVTQVDQVADETEQHEPVIGAQAQPASPPGPTMEAEQVNGHAPDINLALLTAVKESQEFQAIQNRLATSLPTDWWQEDDAHFFAFELLPADESSSNGHEPPVAVFAMRSPEPAPISAVMVTPSADGEEAEVVDLRDPGSRYVAPIVG
ncbi:MAG TPA: hypothetical protein VKE41_20240 [Roseiflexaceae bacterium]|nr:hypothetical protein [Roseiflexaceae bacterium]